MNCEESRALIDKSLVDKLTSKQNRLLEVHIAECRECKQSLHSLSWVWDELENYSLECPNKIKQKVRNRLVSLTTPPISSFRPFPYYRYAIAASVAFIFFLYVIASDDGIPSSAARLHAQMLLPSEILEQSQVKRKISKSLGIHVDIDTPQVASLTLLGAEICNLDDLVAGQIIYQYQGIPISLFVWDRKWPNAFAGIPKNLGSPIIFYRKSYTVVVWENAQVCYCLVAKLDAENLAGIFGLPIYLKQAA